MVHLMKRLLHRIFGKSKTGQNTPKPYAAPEVSSFGSHALAKVNVQDWDPEDQRALRAAATELSNMRRYAGHVEHGYALRAVVTPARCPRCQAGTHQYYANFIYATQVAPRVMFAPAGYFCSQCPTVIIDEEMLRSGITGSFTFHGVLGIEEEESQVPDFFRTWNGQKAMYILDEDQVPQGIATMPASQRPRHLTPRSKRSGRQRMAKAARRRKQRKN
jgi:hypothetical protein